MSSISEPQAAAVAAATPSRVSKSGIEAAVTALLKHKAAQSVNEKPQLLPQDDYFYLNLTLKKIPSNPRRNPYRIPLPHPVLDATGSEVCLIIDDRPRTTTPPSDQIKKLIKSQDIPISKVIKLSKLKANYKPFEARRKLCDSYNVFLVDKRVVHLLPKLIGKEFFRKKKLPLGVDLGKKNLKAQVERILGSALLFISTGTCSVMKVGKMEMEKDAIVENVLDAIIGAVEKVPRKWEGLRSLHLKFSDSVALPVYQAMPDVRLKIEGLKEREEGGEVTETSDNDGGKSGDKKKKKKGRIHEVRYMDVGEDVNSDVDDDMDEIENVDSDVDDMDEIEKVMSEAAAEFLGKEEEDSVDEESKKGKKKRKGRAQMAVPATWLAKKRVKKSSDGKPKKNAKSEEALSVEKPKKNSKSEEALLVDKLKKNSKSEEVLSVEKPKKNAKSEEASVGKRKKGGLSGREVPVPAEMKEERKKKKKSADGRKSAEKVKDVKKKKGASAK